MTCAVPVCKREATEYVQDVARAKWWLCAPCLAGFAERAAAAGGPGYVPVPEADAQMPLGA